MSFGNAPTVPLRRVGQWSQVEIIGWEQRCRKELEINGQLVDSFSARNAVKSLGLPAPPVQAPGYDPNWLPRGFDPREHGWDPRGELAQETRRCIHAQTCPPQDRHPLPTTASHEVGWMLSPARASTSDGGARLARTGSLPSRPKPNLASTMGSDSQYAHTQFSWLDSHTRKEAERRRLRREAKLAKVEAGISEALRQTRHWDTVAPGKKYYRPLGETDVTEYDNHMVRFSGKPLYKSKKSSAPVLMKDGVLVAPWK